MCNLVGTSSRSQMFFKIAVLKNFTHFTGKDLCWSLFLTKLQASRSVTLLKKNICERLLLKGMKYVKVKSCKKDKQNDILDVVLVSLLLTFSSVSIIDFE